ncbi:MAG: hypothetical protein K2L88_01785 [Clostridiales bacterium]|nr:hypothetical protein [Clostridiales bacterium]
MKDKTARVIAIIALIFMAVFVVSLSVSLAGVLSNVFSYVAVGSAAVALALFMLIKISGRGYSITEMNNEIEMEKIRKENERLIAEEKNEENAELRMQNAESEDKE